MADVVLQNLKALDINGKRVKTAYFQGKQLKLTYTVSFHTNIPSGGYYYISGQSGTSTTLAAPSSVDVPCGEAIGSQLPTISGNYTYILGGYTYTITFQGWYTSTSMTTAATSTFVPTANCTLYAKWAMTANVTITKAVTIPKFASGVSWTCYSNGGSRTAVSKTCSSSAGHVALCMAAPGANRNGDSYTWSGCGGKAITALSAQSMTLNGVTRTVSNASAGATCSVDYDLGSNITKSAKTVTPYNSGNFKITISWPKISSTGYQSCTAHFFYASAEKGSYVVCKAYWKEDNDGDLVKQPYGSWDGMSNRSATFASGTYGAAGGYATSKTSTASSHTASIAAASGTGYSRTITVNK